MAVNAAEDGHLSDKTIVDGRSGYTHSEVSDLYEIIKLVTQSLLKCHKMAVNAAEDGHLSDKTIVDGRSGYTHCEVSEIT